MTSVLKTLLDNLDSKISAIASDITKINNRLNDVDSGTTLEEYIDTNNSNISKLESDLQSAGTDISLIKSDVAEISYGLTSVQSEVTTARGDSASLDARLDTMTIATENARSDASTAQTTANEAATSANTANTNIAAAAEPFDSLKARLDDVTTNITNVKDAADTATTNIANINTEISGARLGYSNLSYAVRSAYFSGFGKALNTTSKLFWMNYTMSNANYYTAAGELTTSDNPNAAYTIAKVDALPITLVISIANILTVTSDTLLPSSLAPITIDGVIYNIYFIRLPNTVFANRYAINSSFLNSFPVIAGSSNQLQITMDMIGNTNSTGAVSLTTENANLYIPVLRPKTSPGTVFKFLYTAIDPDTNTVQYLTYNSQITVFL